MMQTAIFLDQSLRHVVHGPIPVDRPRAIMLLAVQPQRALAFDLADPDPIGPAIRTDEYRLRSSPQGEVLVYAWERRA